MTEESKEFRVCKKCGKKYEYFAGVGLGSFVLGSSQLGSDPNFCEECESSRGGVETT